MKLLDYLKETFGLKNDRQLSIAIGISHPSISRIRRGHKKVSAEMIIAIHEKYDMPIAEIKRLCEEA